MFTIFQLIPILPSLVKLGIAAKEIFAVIDRDPEIGGQEETNKTVQKIEIGDGIKFKAVKFRYPTAPVEKGPVMESGNFTIKAGTSTAIVGPSGSGKSTIV